jgi:putative SOS response-associated peptidase YedK
MIRLSTAARALVAPLAFVLILSGCSETQRSANVQPTNRIPAICKKFTSAQEQEACAGRWQVAQDECKREELAARRDGNDQKFSLSKCISKKMNLAMVNARMEAEKKPAEPQA